MAFPTNPIYKLVKDPFSNEANSVLFNDNGKTWHFAMSTDNRMYKNYLKWVEEGNTPEAAD
tara:strand:- start:97 stop:279 length:183 start_codon:yes stop_codon:yes gene_type:complete